MTRAGVFRGSKSITRKEKLEEPVEITTHEWGMKHTYYAVKCHREHRNPDFPYKDYNYYKKIGKHYYEVVNIATKKKIYKIIEEE